MAQRCWGFGVSVFRYFGAWADRGSRRCWRARRGWMVHLRMDGSLRGGLICGWMAWLLGLG
ncbi:MAG: hypothetical protein KJ592_03890 [Nanoarchaeota archaeon]|nr:hypothetical protein [Nanoarchaeota archaeon]